MATILTDIDLVEYSDNRGNKPVVDREQGVIRGVKLLGLESKNGRSYLPSAIAGAKSLYEGAKVNVNHPKGNAQSARDYQDRLGHISAVEHRPDGLYGTLHFNPKHALAEQLCWDAEHAPQNVGLSHNVKGKTVTRNGVVAVEAITHVHSVDLVADPATNKSLFESIETQESAMSLKDITLAQLKAERPDLLESVLTEQASGEAATAAAAELKSLREQVDTFKATEALAAKKAKVQTALTEAKLPKELVTDVFVGLCEGAADDAALAALIEDRKVIAKSIPAGSNGNPQSREQNLAEGAGAAVIPDGKAAAARWR